MSDPHKTEKQRDGSIEAEIEAQGKVPKLVSQLLSLNIKEDKKECNKPNILESFDLEGIAKYIKEKEVKNVICMCGAGISVNAGIPDFRSPKTGIYSRLKEMGLSTPEDVFSIDFFRNDPRPFYTLSKEMTPDKFKPTRAHYFMKLLQDQGMLLRCFTQNIDSLETRAGLDPEKVVAAHGNFDTARCINCRKEVDVKDLMEHIEKGDIMRCTDCRGLVKPDIVFYGEGLPPRFFKVFHISVIVLS